jgi:hypothetical protein
MTVSSVIGVEEHVAQNVILPTPSSHIVFPTMPTTPPCLSALASLTCLTVLVPSTLQLSPALQPLRDLSRLTELRQLHLPNSTSGTFPSHLQEYQMLHRVTSAITGAPFEVYHTVGSCAVASQLTTVHGLASGGSPLPQVTPALQHGCSADICHLFHNGSAAQLLMVASEDSSIIEPFHLPEAQTAVHMDVDRANMCLQQFVTEATGAELLTFVSPELDPADLLMSAGRELEAFTKQLASHIGDDMVARALEAVLQDDPRCTDSGLEHREEMAEIVETMCACGAWDDVSETGMGDKAHRDAHMHVNVTATTDCDAHDAHPSADAGLEVCNNPAQASSAVAPRARQTPQCSSSARKFSKGSASVNAKHLAIHHKAVLRLISTKKQSAVEQTRNFFSHMVFACMRDKSLLQQLIDEVSQRCSNLPGHRKQLVRALTCCTQARVQLAAGGDAGASRTRQIGILVALHVSKECWTVLRREGQFSDSWSSWQVVSDHGDKLVRELGSGTLVPVRLYNSTLRTLSTVGWTASGVVQHSNKVVVDSIVGASEDDRKAIFSQAARNKSLMPEPVRAIIAQRGVDLNDVQGVIVTERRLGIDNFTVRSPFTEVDQGYEQALVWIGSHDAKLQSPLYVVPLGIAAGSEDQEMFAMFADAVERELPRKSQVQVVTIPDSNGTSHKYCVCYKSLLSCDIKAAEGCFSLQQGGTYPCVTCEAPSPTGTSAQKPCSQCMRWPCWHDGLTAVHPEIQRIMVCATAAPGVPVVDSPNVQLAAPSARSPQPSPLWPRIGPDARLLNCTVPGVQAPIGRQAPHRTDESMQHAGEWAKQHCQYVKNTGDGARKGYMEFKNKALRATARDSPTVKEEVSRRLHDIQLFATEQMLQRGWLREVGGTLLDSHDNAFHFPAFIEVQKGSGLPGIAEYLKILRFGCTAPPVIRRTHGIRAFHADGLHFEVKLVEVASSIAEQLAHSHPDQERRLRFQGKGKHNGWRNFLRDSCGVHRNKTGYDGQQAHDWLRTSEMWLPQLEGHPEYEMYVKYLASLKVVLDEALCAKPNRERYAAAVAIMHAVRVGHFVHRHAIGVYEHYAWTHVYDDIADGSLMRFSSIFIEAGNKVWKFSLTTGGNSGGGAEAKGADERQRLKEAAKRILDRAFDEATAAAPANEPPAAARERAAKYAADLVAVDKAVQRAMQLMKLSKSALKRYQKLTHPAIAREVSLLGLARFKTESKRYASLPTYRLDQSIEMAVL